MPQLNRIDRVRGCLLGLAVGDALGAPLEGLSAQQIRAHYGQVDDFVDGSRAWKKKPYRWRMPGLYSDDTQQALALCDVLLECGRIDPDRLAELYLGAGQPQGVVRRRAPRRRPELPAGAGRPRARASRRARPASSRPASARRCGSPRWRSTRSTTSPRRCSRPSMAASLMTHRDIRSLAGALAVAHAVRRLVAGDPREPSFLFRLAADVARDEERIVARDPDVTSVVRTSRQPLPRHRARRVAARPAPRAGPRRAGRGGQPARRRARLQAADDGLPPRLHPDLPLPPADHRQLRGGR